MSDDLRPRLTDPTPLAEQIAREHYPRTSPFPGGLFECACDRRQMFNIDAYAAHIATVTERAVRERIAADIEAHASAEAYGTESGVAWVGGWRSAIARAARIASSPTTVHPGDYLRSATTGRTWLVHHARTAQRGQHAGIRQTLTVTVVPHDHPEPEDVIHDLVWKPKPRKRV